MKEFKNIPKRPAKSHQDLLLDLARHLKISGLTDLASKIQTYVENREDYLEKHANQYVNITEIGVAVISDPSDCPGLTFKIGEEVPDNHAYGLYIADRRADNFYTASIEFDYNMSEIGQSTNVIFDTGCSTTTFDLSVFHWICDQDLSYQYSPSRMNVIGDQIPVVQGKMNIKLGNQLYEDMTVYFANLCFHALLGQDIINQGHLSMDCERGGRVTFTRH